MRKNLPPDKILNIPVCTIVARSVQENNKILSTIFFYMSVFMSMNINLMIILMLFIKNRVVFQAKILFYLYSTYKWYKW